MVLECPEHGQAGLTTSDLEVVHLQQYTDERTTVIKNLHSDQQPGLNLTGKWLQIPKSTFKAWITGHNSFKIYS